MLKLIRFYFYETNKKTFYTSDSAKIHKFEDNRLNTFVVYIFIKEVDVN